MRTALRRNARLKAKSTLQSATGIRSAKTVQTSAGLSGASFNTRGFFHRASPSTLRRVRLTLQLFGFALPAAALLWLMSGAPDAVWLATWPLQYAALLLERGCFFAEATHPQNLRYAQRR